VLGGDAALCQITLTIRRRPFAANQQSDWAAC